MAKTDREMDGKASAVAPTLRLPFELTEPAERAAALDRQQQRKKSYARQLSDDQCKHVEEVDGQFWDIAIPLIEGLTERFQQALKKGISSVNRPVAFTQGRSLAITGIMARLWASHRTTEHLHREQIAALEKRIAELEARPIFEDAGVWAENRSYARGQGTTFDGSFWLAKRSTTFGERPGGCDAWRLAVKRGRDGRDARS